MEIVVFTKRVPVTQEEELRILGDGQSVNLSKLPFRMNDWDNYAVEEAVKIVEKGGGGVTGIAIGDKEADEVLRRAIAMGAKDGILLETEAAPHDPFARAMLAYNFLKKENISFDAIFTGVQAEDDQFAAFGGILAALLKVPFAAQVIGTDTVEKDHLVVRRELEGGLQERVRVSLPCVLSIQSGINEPRYVSIMGVRKASKVERKVLKAAAYAEDAKSLIEVTQWVYPPKKEGAAMITGDVGEVCGKLLGILKEKGVYQ
ncbi:MAG TPA: electron transfer flavoprotein subunit beta/FixA family protein [Syntrophorhabdales bacterium]|nr:electron transfer flavoprotein subunit beta/FixA family protein [Syntrophorhabdales bacterium]